MTTPHSPLGASSAERWINCPGSVALIEAMGPREQEDSEFSREGTAAHEVAALCLTDDRDPWEFIGQTVAGVEVTSEMSEAVALYVNECRRLTTPAMVARYVEHTARMPLPTEPWATVDFAVATDSLLCVNDYKHGAGVVVEVENNPQAMFYAYGLILKHPEVRRVVLRIIQPRAFHPDGPIRKWETTADYIGQWVEDTLKPAMRRTATDGTLDAGKWCRFCPAKLVCPMLTGLFEAAMTQNPKRPPFMTDGDLARNWGFRDVVKMYLKALDDEVYRRAMQGAKLPGIKLVPKKSDRTYKDGADLTIELALGAAAFAPPKLLPPAQLEKVSPEAAALVREWAYKPDAGMTVAPDTDKRDGVSVKTPADVFGSAIEALAE